MRIQRAIVFLYFLPVIFGGSAAFAASGGLFSGAAQSTGFSVANNPAALTPYEDEMTAAAEMTLDSLSIHYKRTGLDRRTGEAYEEVSFFLLAPDLAFTLSAPSRWDWLRVVGGGFVPMAASTRWPEDGPQRYYATGTMVLGYSLQMGVIIKPSSRYGFAATIGPMMTWLTMNSAYDYGNYANSLLPPGADLFTTEDPAMEGALHVKATGLSWIGVLGAWARPIDNLRLGVGLQIPQNPILTGELHVDVPETWDAALLGSDLEPVGDVTMLYPVPWRVHFEAEVQILKTRVALTGEFAKKSAEPVIITYVTDANPSFIEGEQVTAKSSLDDWEVGVRLTHPIDDHVTLGFYYLYDPRCVPDETITVVNLDFSVMIFGAGASWKLNDTTTINGTWAYRYLAPIHIEKSLFSPYAPSESGLSLEPPYGDYSGSSQRTSVNVVHTF